MMERPYLVFFVAAPVGSADDVLLCEGATPRGADDAALDAVDAYSEVGARGWVVTYDRSGGKNEVTHSRPVGAP